jgi:RND family efflux transporter MFP subunit
MHIPKIRPAMYSFHSTILSMNSVIMSKKIWMPCIAAALIWGCETKSEEVQSEGNTSSEEITQAGMIIGNETLETDFRIPGELIAYQEVDLYAKVSSFVEKLRVDVGSQVKKGELLATLEAPEISSRLAGAESRLKSFEAIYLASKASYDRLKRTSETPGTVSENDLEMAFAKQESDLANWESAKAAFKEIMDTKGYLEIRAPFAGVITERNVSLGAYVGPSGKGSEFPIFTLKELGLLRLVVKVPELYAANLKSEDLATFTVQSLPGKEFAAKISRKAGALDDRLRAEYIEMDVPNPEGLFLPGMVAEVTLPIESGEKSLVIPAASVLYSTTGTYVIKKSGDKADWIDVSLGKKSLDQIEIFGKIAPGDTILVHPSEEIRNQSTLNVKLAE